MNIPRAKPTIPLLITQGLGYCCPWFFFRHFRQTAVIAARLGVSTRAVRYAKERVRSGEWRCENREGCMNCRITLAKTPRKLPPR